MYRNGYLIRFLRANGFNLEETKDALKVVSSNKSLT